MLAIESSYSQDSRLFTKNVAVLLTEFPLPGRHCWLFVWKGERYACESVINQVHSWVPSEQFNVKCLGKTVLFSHVLSACISKSRNLGGKIRCAEKSKVFWFLLTLREWVCRVCSWLWDCIHKLIIFQTRRQVFFPIWDACNYVNRNSWGFQFGS